RFGDNDAKKFDQIILTTPSFVTAELIKPIDSTLSEELSKIDYASSAVINFVFDREQIHHPLDGFGFVVPAKENRQMIAGSFNSV
ncbi:hypothetical protein, partial [Klebsiella pneumoniae]|uniref:hypothetical protein n=1 Tax=Klebsiella pneumoniae TaxID=573 RepID=UPI003D06AF00